MCTYINTEYWPEHSFRAYPVLTSNLLPIKRKKRKPPKELQPLEGKYKKRRIESVDFSSSSSSSISGIDCINLKLCSTNVSFDTFAIDDEFEILNSIAFQVQNDTPSK